MLQLTASTASGFAAQDTRTLIAERVRGEFREMPGLSSRSPRPSGSGASTSRRAQMCCRIW